MKILFLAFNQLTSALPGRIGELGNLIILATTGNPLVGAITHVYIHTVSVALTGSCKHVLACIETYCMLAMM
jgi:hypothetical protein